ncbi:MAG TPA: MFS transporter [Angustibacter sp.]|nr:MFS transporter [Angustibacter sp.]
MTDAATRTGAGSGPADRARRREQRAWYFYDWANSAYVTTTLTVLFSPYLITVAEKAACPGLADGATCTTDLQVLGLPVSPGSLPGYVVTVTTLLSALVLPLVGAVADRSGRQRFLLGGFAWVGAVAATLMYLVSGSNWQLGVGLLFVANLALGSSLVVYDAILCQIATADERDRVSSRGWALGYLGGFLLLAVNLAMVTMHDTFGLSKGDAVRVSLGLAGLWWGAFTLIPVLGLRDRPPVNVETVRGGVAREAFGQLAGTFRHMRGYRNTMLFLLAYLFFNDGIQTVIVNASTYGSKELGLDETQLIATILLVQLVAFGGALLFGRLAASFGSHRVVLSSLVVWMGVVIAAFFIPERAFGLFVALAVFIGIVLGGSQALSRSLFSQLIPRGREAEYFSLYQACERGTSWLGTLVFSLVYQFTHTYRWSIVALVVFFLVGGLILRQVDVRQGIEDAGNAQPAVV